MRKTLTWTALLLLALCLLFGLGACAEKEGPLERAGEKMDEAIDDAGDELEDAGDEVEDALDGDG